MGDRHRHLPDRSGADLVDLAWQLGDSDGCAGLIDTADPSLAGSAVRSRLGLRHEQCCQWFSRLQFAWS